MDLINLHYSFLVNPQSIYLFLYFYISSPSEAEIIEAVQLEHFHRYPAFRQGGYNHPKGHVFQSLDVHFCTVEKPHHSPPIVIQFHYIFLCTDELV